jgi:hypothetical protein
MTICRCRVIQAASLGSSIIGDSSESMVRSKLKRRSWLYCLRRKEAYPRLRSAASAGYAADGTGFGEVPHSGQRSNRAAPSCGVARRS